MSVANDSAAEPFLIAASAILPMDPALPPVLHNAGIVVSEGRIGAIGELSDLRRQHGELPLRRERFRGIVLPGFVNAHTHLELSYQSAEKLDGTHFTRWVSSLIASYPAPEALEGVVRDAFRTGARASYAAGVTTVGDITRNMQITRDELRQMPQSAPRVVSFGEIVALGKTREKLPERLAAALGTVPAGMEGTATPPPERPSQLPLLSAGEAVIGLSPHAPYTIEGPALRGIVRAAIIKRTPVCMHLAELSAEKSFLRDLSGPLGREWDLMQKMDILDDKVPMMDGGPIRWAQRWGLLVKEPRDFPTLLAHVNYCDNGELAQLATHACSVVYCPRTHAYFRHPAHRYRDMLEAQVNVCLGTDSLASNPDLNVLREAALLHQRDGLLAYTALDMITRRGAMALGVGDLVGTLGINKYADFVMFPLNVAGDATADSLAKELLAALPGPAAVYLGGVAG